MGAEISTAAVRTKFDAFVHHEEFKSLLINVEDSTTVAPAASAETDASPPTTTTEAETNEIVAKKRSILVVIILDTVERVARDVEVEAGVRASCRIVARFCRRLIQQESTPDVAEFLVLARQAFQDFEVQQDVMHSVLHFRTITPDAMSAVEGDVSSVAAAIVTGDIPCHNSSKEAAAAAAFLVKCGNLYCTNGGFVDPTTVISADLKHLGIPVDGDGNPVHIVTIVTLARKWLLGNMKHLAIDIVKGNDQDALEEQWLHRAFQHILGNCAMWMFSATDRLSLIDAVKVCVGAGVCVIVIGWCRCVA